MIQLRITKKFGQIVAMRNYDGIVSLDDINNFAQHIIKEDGDDVASYHVYIAEIRKC